MATTKTPPKTAPAAATPPPPVELWIELPYGPEDLGLTRRMRVQAPDVSQIAVWRGNGERFGALAQEWGDVDRILSEMDRDDPRAQKLRDRKNGQAAHALGRALKVLKSLLLEPSDRDWLEDQLTEGGMTLDKGGAQVMSLTIEAARAYSRSQTPVADVPQTKAKLTS